MRAALKSGSISEVTSLVSGTFTSPKLVKMEDIGFSPELDRTEGKGHIGECVQKAKRSSGGSPEFGAT